MQVDRELVIAYARNALLACQRNYCTTYRELLAVVLYTNKFQHYLVGNDFRIRTDHASLKWCLKLARNEVCEENVEYRPGQKHVNADALSSCPSHPCKQEDCTDCTSQEIVVGAIEPVEEGLEQEEPNWGIRFQSDEV